jgi:hypothetical protein
LGLCPSYLPMPTEIASIIQSVQDGCKDQLSHHSSAQRSKNPICHSFQPRTEGGRARVLAYSVAASSRITSAGKWISAIAEVSFEELWRRAETESADGVV